MQMKQKSMTKSSTPLRTSKQNLLRAALALPGLAASLAHAQSAPQEGLVSLKYLDYQDAQPGEKRMRVKSPSFFLATPISSTLAIEGSVTLDSVSGASPLYHNTLSGASGKGVSDFRKTSDVKFTRYFERGSIGIGALYSTENDYLSRAVHIDGRYATEDQNTTVALGLGGSHDQIDSVNGVARGEKRNTQDYLLGVTQILSTHALLQSNLTYSRGRGYYSDPYKPLDVRPMSREQFAWLTRYNHYFPSAAAALHFSYRYYRDTFNIKAHTLEATWLQTLPNNWTVSPSLRYYTQSAASFYRDPPFPQGFILGQAYSADHRLAAFGAWASGVKIIKRLADGWSVDFQAEFYKQKSDWRLGGGGSPGLSAFSARTFIVGISKKL